MKARALWLRVLAVAGGLLVLAGLATRARVAPSRIEPAASTAAGEADPATGAILVDLDDSAGQPAWARVRDAIARGVAPLPFTVDDSPRDKLGALLSDEAELYRLEVPASEVGDVLEALRGLSDVEGAERERIWSIPEGADDASASVSDAPDEVAPAEGEGGFRPNDPYYRHQWHLDLIGMPRAWQRSRGDGVVVAVIDTGVAFRSAGRFLQAPDLAETRFVPGYDFVDGDESPEDEHGNGTHVAGTIAQSTDNGLGVAGVAPGASIMPLRVLDRSGAGTWGAIAAAIRWAADHGAHVINMSLGGGSRSLTIERAIAYAHERGVVVVAAAGNTGRAPVEYPARHPHVIVGSVRLDRELAPYSSRGGGLDISAPGGDLRVDQNGDGLPDGVLQNTLVQRDPRRFDYLAWQGTSMAAPHVAGVAALVRASGVTDPDAIERVLLETAEPIGEASLYGAGLVRADRALERQLDGRGMMRGVLAALLVLAVILLLLRRGVLGLSRPWLTGVLAFTLAGGFAFLPLDLLGLSSLDAWVGDGVAALFPFGTVAVLAAFLLPVALSLVFLQHRALRPFLVGLGAAVAASLVVEALDPSVSLAGGFFAGPLLVLGAAALTLLGRQIARSERVAALPRDAG